MFMSYFNPTIEADAPLGCINCGSTENLMDIWPDDSDKSVRACYDCCEEIRRVEAIADQLAALPSCDVRQAIIDNTDTTRIMVNALTAHDQACGCAKRKMPHSSDCASWVGEPCRCFLREVA